MANSLTEDEEVLPANPAHPLAICGGQPVRGLKVEYVPQPGYAGEDKTLYYIDNQRADVWIYYQTIEVN